jgi:hypothetical protein
MQPSFLLEKTRFKLWILAILAFLCTPLLVSTAFAQTPVLQQLAKPNLVNTVVPEVNYYPQVPMYESSNSSQAETSSSCWNYLDPTFSNITNSMSGTPGTWSYYNPGDDGSYGAIALPFTYTFYEQDYTSLYINVNGNVTFGDLYSAYSASGFPANGVPAMIAPFWGDVDLRGTGSGSNQIYYKLDSNKITIVWVEVGYYNQNTDITNTFQLVLTNGTDVGVGIGYNTRFSYDNMDWCVGDASGGTNGFGSSVYATVGAQSQNGTYFYQIGLFGQDNELYDGAGGNLDGVHWLDSRCFTMDLTSNNVPPVAYDLPSSREISLCPNMTYILNTSFASPEVNQTTIATVSCTTLSNFNYTSTQENLSQQSITIYTSEVDTGTHYVIYTATDNGTPANTTIDTLKIHVLNCGSSGDPASLYFDGSNDYVVVPNHLALQNGGSNTFMAWVYPETPSGTGEEPIMFKDEQFFLGMDAATNIPKFKAYIGGAWHALDGNSALTTNEWNHLIGMVTGSQMKLFVDGELISENNVSGSTNFSMDPLYIGANIGTGNYYNGRIDELSIWSSAYDNESIKEHRWENGSADNLLYQRAYFKFNKGVALENNTVNPGTFEPFLSGTLTNIDTNTCWKQNYASVWKGTEDSDYNNEKNWQDGMIPNNETSGSLDAVKYVIVPKNQGDNNLIIDETIDVSNLIMNINSDVTIKQNGKIRIQENLYSYGNTNYLGEIGFNGNGTQHIYGENNFEDLTIGANVLLEANQTIKGELTLNTGTLDINGKVLTIQSDSTATGEIYHNSGSINGEVTLERYLDYDSTSFGWHYLSSPMNAATFYQIDDDVPLVGIGNLPTDNPWPNVMTYDETNTSTNSQTGWGSPANSNVVIEPMQGFVLALFWINATIDFTGVVNNGPITRLLTNTASGNSDADGWNFIGNPYPSMIDWSKVTIPNGMYDGVYLYDSERDMYASYVGGYGVNGATNRIASMQGFYVRASNNNVLFELTNDARTSGDNDAHFKDNEPDDFVIDLNVFGENVHDELIVRLLDDASPNFDPQFDAYKLFGIENKLSIYTRIGIDKASINSMPYPTSNKVIPITMETNASGDYTFIINNKDDIDSNMQVYLEDTKLSLLHDITSGEPYDFVFQQEIDENRFNIRFKIDGDSSEVNPAFEAYYYNQKIHVIGLEEETEFRLYSVSGNLILSELLAPSTEKIIVLDELGSGCYIMSLSNSENQLIKRLLKEPKIW